MSKRTKSFRRGVKRDIRHVSKTDLFNHYMDYALKIITAYLNSIEFYYDEPYDYLLNYFNAFEKAYQNYDKKKSCFKTYLKSVLLSELYNEIGKEIRKNYYLYNSISLDTKIEVNDDDTITLVDTLADPSVKDPREEINFAQTLKLCDSGKVAVEKKEEDAIKFKKEVLIYKSYGYTLEEIAEALNTTVGRVRYVISKKHKEYFKETDIR